MHTYVRTYVHPSIHPSMHAYIHTYIHTCRHTHIHTYIQTYKPTNLQTYIHTNIQTYKHTNIHTYIQTYKHTNIQTYKHTNIHTYIQTYKHTYKHTYIHTFTRIYIYAYTIYCSTLIFHVYITLVLHHIWEGYMSIMSNDCTLLAKIAKHFVSKSEEVWTFFCFCMPLLLQALPARSSRLKFGIVLPACWMVRKRLMTRTDVFSHGSLTFGYIWTVHESYIYTCKFLTHTSKKESFDSKGFNVVCCHEQSESLADMKTALTRHKYARPGLQLTLKWRTCSNVLTLDRLGLFMLRYLLYPVVSCRILLYPVVVMTSLHLDLVTTNLARLFGSLALRLFGSTPAGKMELWMSQVHLVHFFCHFRNFRHFCVLL